MTMYPSRNRGAASSVTSRLSPLSGQKRQSATPPVARQAPVYPQQPAPSPAPQQSENAQMKTTIPPDPAPQQQYTPPPMTQPGVESPIMVNPNLPPPQPMQQRPGDTMPPVDPTQQPDPAPAPPQGNPWDTWTPQTSVNAATISRWQYAAQNPAAMPAFYKSLGVMFADNPRIDWSKINTTWMTNLITRAAAGLNDPDMVRQFLQNQVNNLIAYGQTGNPNNPGNGPQPAPQPAPLPPPPAPPAPTQFPAPPPGRRSPVSRYSVKTPGVSSGNGVYTGR